MFSKHDSYVVIGLGTFGMALARGLAESGARVLGIDRKKELVDRYHAELDNTIQADASDIRALGECAIDSHDVVIVAIGDDVESSLFTARNCLKLGAKSVRAKAQSEPQEDILRALGITEIDTPEMDGGRALARSLTGEPAQ